MRDVVCDHVFNFVPAGVQVHLVGIEGPLQQDAVDELQLTLVPRLLGGGKTWLSGELASLPEAVTTANAWSAMEPEALGEGEWLLRYRRVR